MFILLLLMVAFSFAQKTTPSSRGSNIALGGIADYDPSLIHFLFDTDELELMLADPQQNGTSNTAVRNAYVFQRNGSKHLQMQRFPNYNLVR